MTRSRTLLLPLSLLGLFLLGTVVVLSTVSYYLAIEPTAYLTDTEVPATAGTSSNDSHALERVPRIIHQTWKTNVLPERWKAVSKTCTSLMPDYEYMLWTDEKSREFIAKEYPWFLPTFDGYAYPIQRADAIRYFVLHYYGGVYLDLDVGCIRPLDPLLQYPVILPKTIPVGVSNDLMFSAKGHPFMEQTIHNLITFDHNYFLNYPTVMFSTGPMYVSAQYGLYVASHPHRATTDDVRVLAKSLYGKNASPLEAPNSFFSHHYGSSWHADDAAFITFLGKWGRMLMKFGTILLVFGLARVYWARRGRGARTSIIRRRLAFTFPVQLLLPRGLIEPHSRRLGHRHNLSGETVDLTGLLSSITSPHSGAGESSDEATAEMWPPTSPDSSHPTSPTLELPGQLSFPVLHVPYDLRSDTPSPVPRSGSPLPSSDIAERISETVRRAGSWAMSFPYSYFSRSGPTVSKRERSDSVRAHVVGRAPFNGEPPRPSLSGRRGTSQRRTGRTSNGSQSFITFLPAIFTPASGSGRRHSRSSSHAARREREKLSDAEAALSDAAEIKAREAGFRLPKPINTAVSLSAGGPPSDTLLSLPYSNVRAAHASTVNAGPSRAETPSPTPLFYTPRTSLSSSALGLESNRDREKEVDRNDGAWSPLLIDPLEGSDVRTTRSASASVAVAGAPPPYRATIVRSTSLGSEGSGIMTP